MPRSGIARSYDSSSFLGNFHTIFHSDYRNLYSVQLYKGFFVSVTLSAFVGFCFLNDIPLTELSWDLSVVLIFTFLVAKVEENFSIFLLAMYISSFEKYLFRSFVVIY
jgi:hypothetical protein